MNTTQEMEEYKHYEVDLKLELSIFFISTLFGIFHRNIESVQLRKWTSTLAGFGLIVFMIPEHLWHFLSLCSLIIAIIKLVDHRKVQLYVTVSVVTYMTLVSYTYYQELRGEMLYFAQMAMISTASMIGLSYYIYLTKQSKLEGHDLDYITDPGIMEIVHFMFCYVGKVTGICYRYRTYDDFINKPFARGSNYFHRIVDRLTRFTAIVLMASVLEQYAPYKFIVTTEFQTRGFWFKCFYSFVQLQYFCCIMHMLYLKSEIIGIASGFGAYPIEGENQPGFGPMKRYKEILKISESEGKDRVYDFETIKCSNSWEYNTNPWMSNSIRNWNMTHRFWLSPTYNRLAASPKYKKFSLIITFIVSTLWHTNHQSGAVFAILIGIHIELSKYYWKISNNLTGWAFRIHLFAQLVFRWFILATVGTIFLMFDFKHVVKYLKTMNYFPIVALLLYYVVGRLFHSVYSQKLNVKYNKEE